MKVVKDIVDKTMDALRAYEKNDMASVKNLHDEIITLERKADAPSCMACPIAWMASLPRPCRMILTVSNSAKPRPVMPAAMAIYRTVNSSS